MVRTLVLFVFSACLLTAQNKSSGAEQDIMRIEKEMLAAALKGDTGPSERYRTRRTRWRQGTEYRGP
jgi:hypothetical protein